MTEIFSTVVMP